MVHMHWTPSGQHQEHNSQALSGAQEDAIASLASMKLMSGMQPGDNDDGFVLRTRGRSSSLPTSTVISALRQNTIQCTSAPLLDGLGLPLGSTEEHTLVHLLLEKVTSLSYEKQCLSEQTMGLQQQNAALQQEVVGLQRENQQLSSLVTDLSDTLQQQQHQARLLLHLQRQHMIKASGRVSPPPQAPLTPAPQQLKQATILAQQQLAQQMAQRGRALGSAAFADAAPRMASSLKRDQQHSQQQQQQQVCGDDEVCTEVSATLPFLDLQQQAQQQQDTCSSSQRAQQERVAEWLQERGWQEWQGRLPLEPMSSSSSSSLMMALEESMPRN